MNGQYSLTLVYILMGVCLVSSILCFMRVYHLVWLTVCFVVRVIIGSMIVIFASLICICMYPLLSNNGRFIKGCIVRIDDIFVGSFLVYDPSWAPPSLCADGIDLITLTERPLLFFLISMLQCTVSVAC